MLNLVAVNPIKTNDDAVMRANSAGRFDPQYITSDGITIIDKPIERKKLAGVYRWGIVNQLIIIKNRAKGIFIITKLSI